MFGLDFAVGGGEGEKEDGGTSDFFNFQGGAEEENEPSFSLHFKMDSHPQNVDIVTSDPNPHTFNLFDRKEDGNKESTLPPKDSKPEVKMEVDSETPKTKQYKVSPAKPSTTLSPWKTALHDSHTGEAASNSIHNVKINDENPNQARVSPGNVNRPENDQQMQGTTKEWAEVEMTSTLELKGSPRPLMTASGKAVRRNLFAGTTPKKCPQNVEDDSSMVENNQGEDFNKEIRGNPVEFVSFLRNQFGSSEEFGQFERYFYGQTEEVRMLRANVESLRSALVKTQEEKRVLELKLVSEQALRDQEAKNALTELEKNNMQLNTQIYSMKCEVETWKRKAEGTLKESSWMKKQLKSLELEKTEAVRKLGDLTQQHSGFEQYRVSIEAYGRRQREAMSDIQKKLLDLEKARDTLAALTDHNQKQMNFIAVHLKNRESYRLNTEKRIEALEDELIKARAELVQNNAKLVRLQTCEAKKTDLMEKLISENGDLHCGINLLLSSMRNNVGERNVDFLNRIEKIHLDVEHSVRNLQND